MSRDTFSQSEVDPQSTLELPELIDMIVYVF